MTEVRRYAKLGFSSSAASESDGRGSLLAALVPCGGQGHDGRGGGRGWDAMHWPVATCAMLTGDFAVGDVEHEYGMELEKISCDRG